ncbi:hypothetical protein [Paenibacillus sp. FSL E2-0178]|uniref:hypothetical protein n=1 Tax=Paenibacillus sp. FSL E2-0178 TaxID=2921361 RepID=UPI0031580472
MYEQYKSVPKLDIVYEEGIYGVMYASNSGHANEFKKFMRREVNPSIRENGNFDMIYFQIESIADEKERDLSKKVHTLYNLNEIDPSDKMALIMLKDAERELQSSINTRDIVKVRNEISELKDFKDAVIKSTVLREGELSPSAISKKFNIYSINNIPHILFADSLARELGFYIKPEGNSGYQDEFVSVHYSDRAGETIATVKYSEFAFEKMKNHIENNGLILQEHPIFYKGRKEGAI